MDAWAVWLVVAALLAIAEILTLDLVLISVAGAALVAAAAAGAGAGVGLQLLVFAVSTMGMLLLVRPVAIRHLRTPTAVRTNAAALPGQQGTVMGRVDADGGLVKIGGEIWSARAWDSSQVLEPGTRVDVVEISGATALVWGTDSP